MLVEKTHQNPHSHVAWSNGGDKHIFPLSSFGEELCCHEMLSKGSLPGLGMRAVRENFTGKILPELSSERGIGVSDIEGGDRGDLEGGADNGDVMSRAPWLEKKKRAPKQPSN